MKANLKSARRLLALALLLTLANAAGALVPRTLPQDFLKYLSVINLLGGIALALEALFLERLRAFGSANPSPPEALINKPRISREERTRHELAAFLGLLQDKGRLVDFVMEDITAQPDARIGQVARVVHQGCREILKKHFDLAPVGAAEGVEIDLSDCAAEEIRLLGTVGAAGVRKGVVVHPGWISRNVTLPELSHDLPENSLRYLVSPAEVEVRG